MPSLSREPTVVEAGSSVQPANEKATEQLTRSVAKLPIRRTPPTMTGGRPVLRFINGGREGDLIEVTAFIIAGRQQEAHLVIPDPKVSRRHFCLMYDGFFLTAIDDGSANGSYLNGNRITCPVILYPGDILRAGDTELRVEAEHGSGLGGSL